MSNPFITQYQHLPNTIPIFPLAGAIVMPGAQLPLNIFEPRYLNMIEDAMSRHHLIGMIQPQNEQDGAVQQLFDTGCSGRITSYNETTDGRIEIILTGVCRFDIMQELSSTRGYRLIAPSWKRFKADYESIDTVLKEERKLLDTTLVHYLNANNLQADIEQLKLLPSDLLVNILSTSLPLAANDKQSIIEAVSIHDRLRLLITKLKLSSYPSNTHLRH